MQGSQPTALRMQMATYVMQGYKVDQEDLATLRDSFQDLPRRVGSTLLLRQTKIYYLRLDYGRFHSFCSR